MSNEKITTWDGWVEKCNALQVLESRMANREQEFVQSPYWDQREPEHHTQWGQKETRDPVYGAMWMKPERPPYHSPEWWDMMWKKHEEWRLDTYPAPAGTGWEVTPPTGKEVK